MFQILWNIRVQTCNASEKILNKIYQIVYFVSREKWLRKYTMI